MFDSKQTAGQSPRQKSRPIYISKYINDYGRPWTPVDVNLKIRSDHGQIAGTGGELLATTDQMVKWSPATFPRPLKYPRRGVGRNGAFGVAMRWRQRHHCPRHHDEYSGQDQGTGRSRVGLGKSTNEKSVPSACPTGGSTGVFHGYSRSAETTAQRR
jgi:hypothetical protein